MELRQLPCLLTEASLRPFWPPPATSGTVPVVLSAMDSPLLALLPWSQPSLRGARSAATSQCSASRPLTPASCPVPVLRRDPPGQLGVGAPLAGPVSRGRSCAEHRSAFPGLEPHSGLLWGRGVWCEGLVPGYLYLRNIPTLSAPARPSKQQAEPGAGSRTASAPAKPFTPLRTAQKPRSAEPQAFCVPASRAQESEAYLGPMTSPAACSSRWGASDPCLGSQI